jgi:hypothetical protein
MAQTLAPTSGASKITTAGWRLELCLTNVININANVVAPEGRPTFAVASAFPQI